MDIQRERDILEYFPIALYTIAMIVKSGGSLEKGLKFVADRNYGRVSRLFQRVIAIGLQENITKGLESIRYVSRNRYYREALVVMQQYAKHDVPVGDRLAALGNRMQREAVMEKRNHYQRVANALVPQTSLLLIGIPFLFMVTALLLSNITFDYEEPILDKEHVEYVIVAWLGILSFCYPVFYFTYIIKNPVFVTPSLLQLKQMFGTQYDGPISRFLDNTANFIEMGWSVEMAVLNALPHQLSTGIYGDDGLARHGIGTMSDSTRTFSQALLRLGAFVNHQKFYLTVEFIDEAKNSKYASISETLHLLAESFWSSHITSHHYQFDAMTPVGISIGFKIVSMYALGTLFPMFMPFLILFILVDLILMMLCIL